MANRLAAETSPYLLQHRDNPVDWYPWGDAALERARDEDKPILLSIGYAACHWCHVMAHESFEDPETAQLMNELFVNIKVDREERPDLDAIYMQAVQALTGQGGWPMTMFLTPKGEPFYGGTYYPPSEQRGMPSFRRVLRSVADAWKNRRDAVASTVQQVAELYSATVGQAQSEGTFSAHTLELAYRGIAQRYDIRHGGFDGAPKFPPTMSLDFLLRYWKRTGTEYALEMAVESFRRMSRGGIYDQVGGGFHRYSVDAVWLVPHFEKMLYDNALLVRLGAYLWQATKDADVRRVTEETLEWVEREMTSPEGGFYSSLDADSEGHEGKFYVWSEEEIDSLLGDRSALVKSHFAVTARGNFEGKNILNVPTEPTAVAARGGVELTQLNETLREARQILYAARAKRVWPARDEKILAGWNGLMLRGVATAARAFGMEQWRELALRNGNFLHRVMVQGGRVMRSHKDGETRIPGFLEDHAAVALGFLSLYELTFDASWIDIASEITTAIVEWFWDPELNVFFDTARDAEQLITRPRDASDNAIPSGNSLAAELLLHLAELKHDAELGSRGTFVIESSNASMSRFPTTFGHLLGAADLVVHGAVEVAIAGRPGNSDFSLLEGEVSAHYVPSLVLAGGDPEMSDNVALMNGRALIGGRATAYVCRSYSCDEPAQSADVLGRQLEAAGAAQRIVAQE
jgi:uncharacterized protein YyaL (SSP411 family)